MPQTDVSVTADIVSLTGVNGICTSQRRPPLSVSVGVSRQESCANSEYMLMSPSRRRGANAMYVLVVGVERGLAGDRCHAAGQQRVELARVGQLRGRRAREVACVLNRPAAGSFVGVEAAG